jgi:hypothetical protein
LRDAGFEAPWQPFGFVEESVWRSVLNHGLCKNQGFIDLPHRNVESIRLYAQMNVFFKSKKKCKGKDTRVRGSGKKQLPEPDRRWPSLIILNPET